MQIIDIRLDEPTHRKTIPDLISLPLQLSIISLGLFFLTAFGSIVVTQGIWQILGIQISSFTLFIVFLVFALLLILC